MALSKNTIETLIDLVEIKLSCFEIYDREDNRELNNLERCRDELRGLIHVDGKTGVDPSSAVSFRRRGRGRPRASATA